MDNQGQPAQTSAPNTAAAADDSKAVFGAGEQQGAKAQAAKAEAPTSTQNSLMISEIRDSMLILRDGSFRAVVACKSINFDLMSTSEREGVEYSFQNFLNSLYFDIQILIRSQRVDIGPYLDRLAELRRSQDNMLLNVLMDDYMNFIDVLSQEANIMSKEFYIVVPYFATEDAKQLVEQGKGFFKKLLGSSGPTVTKINKETYDKALSEMNNRVDSVSNGMFQIGVQSARLSTKELGELFYNFNNPDTALREPLGDFSKVAQLYASRAGDKPRAATPPQQPAQPPAQPVPTAPQPAQAPAPAQNPLPQQPLPPTGVANG
ncbi:MAG: hypothetical protein LBL84_00765 [Candidatus Nomurabacteria bacterium]|jgi:hypothetical protein|nr:hypothetical protein [Candidatus Nomurabacteria bacterium]